MEIHRCMKCMNLLKPEENVCPVCGHTVGFSASESFALKPGTILDGKYLVGEMLGQGGFGITYIGFDLLLEQKVAIKEYYPMSTGMVSRENRSTVLWSSAMLAKTGVEKGFDSFLKEARKMAKLGGIPGVVGVKSVFIQNETAYIVMDFIQGQTLQKKLEKEGPMDYGTCLTLLTPIMEALAQVHKHGIIHRDISPDNIMVQPDGSLVLLDLGAAKDLEIQKSDGTLQSSQLVAKHGFSPLEQYTRSGQIGSWTDVYAMAATVYYCCTGKLPPAAVERVGKDELACRPNLTKSQFTALSRGMAILEKNRIQTMEELLRTLAKQRSTTPPDPPHPKLPKWLIPGVAALAAVALLVGLTTGKKTEKPTSTALPQQTLQTQAPQPTTQPTEPAKTFPMAHADTVRGGMVEDYGTTNFWNQYDHTRAEVEKIVFQSTLRGAGTDAWDMSEAGDGSVLAWMDGSTLYIGANGNIAPNPDADQLFDSFVNLREIDFGGCFDTGSVTRMYGMFWNCQSLETVDVSGFDTSNVTDMRYMFSGCTNLRELDASGFDTAQVTMMEAMFYNCPSLEYLDVSTWNTGKVESFVNMFSECISLKELDVSGFDTSAAYDIQGMFFGCKSLEELDVSHFNTTLVQNMWYTFGGCESLKALDVSNFDTGNVWYMGGMFSGCRNLKTLDVSGFNTSRVSSMGGSTEREVVGTTYYEGMFSDCRSLTELNLSNFNTGLVENMRGIFKNCESLKSLDISGFNTSMVTDMDSMFYGCRNLEQLDVSLFDTARVTDMSYMFRGCRKLKTLDLSGFDTFQVTDMSYMFYECYNLTSLDLSNFDASQANSLIATFCMFTGCSNLTDLKCSDSTIREAYNNR